MEGHSAAVEGLFWSHRDGLASGFLTVVTDSPSHRFNQQPGHASYGRRKIPAQGFGSK